MGLSPNNTLVFQYCLEPFSLPSQTKDRILFARRLFLVVSDLDIDIYRKKRCPERKRGPFPQKTSSSQPILFVQEKSQYKKRPGWLGSSFSFILVLKQFFHPYPSLDFHLFFCTFSAMKQLSFCVKE